ncbi:AI-2E family transporter [Rhizobium paranaense]|uniref:Putative PurR-regulated permease PerM n=1 Tax=Rhizobium paranaense TaxID=1650438 RepID=A0A7W9D2N9_9HYPH|nr:AI-2E family transporter [Rhizobium paranaense]MBB5575478.1 putative PurR-regulated permease PerM [Rhizobium paranaense]
MQSISAPPAQELAGDTNSVRTSPSSADARIGEFIRLAVAGLFAYWSFTIVAPFILIIAWAAILAVALFPVFELLRKLLGPRGIAAAVLIVIACLAIVIAPLATILFGFADGTRALLTGLKEGTIALPSAPESIKAWPYFGERAFELWNYAIANFAEMLKQFQEPIRAAAGVILERTAALAGGVLSFIASLLLCGVFLVTRQQLVSAVNLVVTRIAGNRGTDFVRLASITVRNVSRGIIGIALLQTLLCGLLLFLFDVPAQGVLSFVVFILCIIQIGPGIVLLPLVIWAWFAWPFTDALLFMLLAVPIALLDNILKPILISRGLSTPMPLILLGVIGGTLAHGLVGLFLGPVVLGVFYDLFVAWTNPTVPAGESPAVTSA